MQSLAPNTSVRLPVRQILRTLCALIRTVFLLPFTASFSALDSASVLLTQRLIDLSEGTQLRTTHFRRLKLNV